jgi:propionate CoA-transferase
MNIFTKAYYLALMGHIRLTWNRHDSAYAFHLPDNPKFMGAREAAKLIPDGAVVATSGLGGNQRPSILYWTIREAFEATGHPRDLTVMCTGGQGGRGIAPGSVEEIMREGLCRRVISGHVETFKSALRLAEQGLMEVQLIPQGMVALLFEALGRGENSLLTHVGVNTFLDPRVGRGTPLAGRDAEQLVSVEGDLLRFRVPGIDVALFNAYAADREGNIYVTHCPMKAEILEITRAAKRNGGQVIANVSRLIDKTPGDIYVPAAEVDAVVVHPQTEQSGYIRYNSHFEFLAPTSRLPMAEGLARARFVNKVMGITPRRSAMDHMLARLAAEVFVHNVSPGSLMNVGVGLPEEVCSVLHQAHILDEVTLFTESGVIGGVPMPGIFFGAAVGAKSVISSAETFRMCPERLDGTVLGVLQADSRGNVNVSKRGDRISSYVGPGGFIDLTNAAKTILFVTKWAEGEKMALEGGRVRVLQQGRCKFIEAVDEVTMNGPESLKAGKKVFYATSRCLLQLTARGMELVRVMPGIDIDRDILATTKMTIALPEQGTVPVVEGAIITGKEFRLQLGKGLC